MTDNSNIDLKRSCNITNKKLLSPEISNKKSFSSKIKCIKVILQKKPIIIKAIIFS